MKYRVECLESGIVFGDFEANTPEEAIRTMLTKAGCADYPKDLDIIASEIN